MMKGLVLVLLNIALAAAAALTGAQQVPLADTARHHRGEGLEIPLLGFGTWNLSPDDHNASDAVKYAIEEGYRHIDCAAIYGNEKDVGRGIHRGLRAARLSRRDIWVTSKLWNDHHGSRRPYKALKQTLRDLQLDYIDLYLMHWPVATEDGNSTIEFVETWRAMEGLLKRGHVRHIGVSNFSPAQLSELLKHARVKPYAHQMELHPYLPQSAWLQYHRELGIHVTAYSPLGNMNPNYRKPNSLSSYAPTTDNGDGDGDGDDEPEPEPGPQPKPWPALPPRLIDHPTLIDVASKRRCTPARVALTWGMTRGTSVIPKSQHENHIKENRKPCFLEYEDIRAIQRIGMANLTRFNNPSKGWGVSLFDGLQDV